MRNVMLGFLLALLVVPSHAQIIKKVDSFTGDVEWYADEQKNVGVFNSIFFRVALAKGVPKYYIQVYNKFNTITPYIGYNATATLKVDGKFSSLGSQLNGINIEYGVFDAKAIVSALRASSDQPMSIRVSSSAGTLDAVIDPYMLKEWVAILDAKEDTTLDSRSAPVGVASFKFNSDHVVGYAYDPTSTGSVAVHVYVNGQLANSGAANKSADNGLFQVPGLSLPLFGFDIPIGQWVQGKGPQTVQVFGVGNKGVNSLLSTFVLQSGVDVDCVYNNAEAVLPGVFVEKQTTTREGQNLVRRYSNGALLAIDRMTGQVGYALPGNGLVDGGNISQYKTLFGC